MPWFSSRYVTWSHTGRFRSRVQFSPHSRLELLHAERLAQETSVEVLQISSAVAQIANQTQTVRERVGAFAKEIHAAQK